MPRELIEYEHPRHHRGAGHLIYGASAVAPHVYEHLHRRVTMGTQTHRSTSTHRGTQTKKRHRKDKEGRIVAGDLPTGINASFVKAWLHKPVKGFIKGTFVRTQEAYQTSGISIAGVQGIFLISEIGGMANACGLVNGFASAQDLTIPAYQVIPDTGRATQTYYNGSQDSALTQRLIMRHTELNMQFVSATNANQTVKVYLVKAKQNLANQPTGTAGLFNRVTAPGYWQQCLTEENVGRPQQTQLTGGSGAPGYQNQTMPNATPSQSRTFKKLFEIVGVHTIHLAPNGVEVFNLSIFNNQVMDIGKITAMTADGNTGVIDQPGAFYNTGLLKGGYSVFATILGQPAKDNTSGTGTGQFTYAPVECGVIVDRKISWAGLKSVTNNYVSLQAENNLLVNPPRDLFINQNTQISSSGVKVGDE